MTELSLERELDEAFCAMAPADRRNLITAAPANTSRESPFNPDVEQRALGAALGYAALSWPVSPWATRGNRKFPLTSHGHLDATTDPAILEEWWTRWPCAIPAIATGQPSGVVALDIDIRPAGSGFESLGELGIVFHPEGPTTHTPRGGGRAVPLARLFRQNLFRRACPISRYPRRWRFADLTARPWSLLGSSPWTRNGAATYARMDADRFAAYTAGRRAIPASASVALRRGRTRRGSEGDHQRA
jgi:hypothetical protein